MPRIVIASESTADNPSVHRPQGGAFVLRNLLAQAGIEQPDFRFIGMAPEGDVRSLITSNKTTRIPDFPPIEPGKFFPASSAALLGTFISRINAEKPNVIIALGNLPLWALTKHTGIAKWRGTPLLTPAGTKVIPTWPIMSIIKQWDIRPIVFMDLMKAKRHAASPILSRPQRYIHMPESIEDIEAFYEKYIVPAERVSCDVETKGNTITEVGFAPTPKRALVIPFLRRPNGSFWATPELEKQAWYWVERILAEKGTFGQNFQYDMQYFIRTVSIPVPNFEGDTMLLHHSLQPELKKGLGFLSSIYTDQAQWKDMRAAGETLKREDD